jgi:hypothetical protein
LTPRVGFSATNKTTRLEDPKKPKRGTWRLPVSALLIFAIAALISASGGTHRVRGVMVAVCVLSPVESTSPPQLYEQQFPSTPVPELWQEGVYEFHDQEC